MQWLLLAAGVVWTVAVIGISCVVGEVRGYCAGRREILSPEEFWKLAHEVRAMTDEEYLDAKAQAEEFRY